MKIRDKNLKAEVAVRDPACLALPCYRPRRDPGILIPGIGYRERAGGNGGYECGWREVHGCPNPAPVRAGQGGQALTAGGRRGEDGPSAGGPPSSDKAPPLIRQGTGQAHLTPCAATARPAVGPLTSPIGDRRP